MQTEMGLTLLSLLWHYFVDMENVSAKGEWGISLGGKWVDNECNQKLNFAADFWCIQQDSDDKLKRLPLKIGCKIIMWIYLPFNSN